MKITTKMLRNGLIAFSAVSVLALAGCTQESGEESKAAAAVKEVKAESGSMLDKATDATSNMASDLKSSATDAVGNMSDSAKEAAGELGDGAKEAMTAVTDTVESAAGDAMDKVEAVVNDEEKQEELKTKATDALNKLKKD